MTNQEQAVLKLPPEPSCTWYEPYAGPGGSLVTYRVYAVGKSFFVKWLDGDDWITCATPVYGMSCIVHRAWTREVERLENVEDGCREDAQKTVGKLKDALAQQALCMAAVKAAERETK